MPKIIKPICQENNIIEMCKDGGCIVSKQETVAQKGEAVLNDLSP
jgi:hypothetical protein